jgi:hypothetical protein
MKRKVLYTSVAAALLLGGATTALAQQYYVIQPASERVIVQPVANERVIIEERVVTRPAQPAVVAVPGETITMTYGTDQTYPFPSPATRFEQTGVFVPTQPMHSAPAKWADEQARAD